MKLLKTKITLKAEEILLLIVTFGVVFYFAVLNLFSFSDVARIGNDSIDFILPALAPKFDMGVPYKDYLENNPPGILLLTWGWASFFGYSNLSFKILHLVTLFGSPVLVYLLSRKLFSYQLALLLSIFSSIALFSSKLNTFLLTSEQIGLFFSLLGLFFLVRLDDTKLFWRFFLSSFFLAWASQIKDPFLPVIISLLPPLGFYLLKKEFRRFFQASLFILLGISLCLGIIVFYLKTLGSLDAYISMLLWKNSIYNVNYNSDYLFGKLTSLAEHAKSLIIYVQYQLNLLFFLAGGIFFLNKVIKKEISLKRGRNNFSLVINTRVDLDRSIMPLIFIFYILGSFLGFAIQARFESHYLIQVVVPTYFLISMVLVYIGNYFINFLSGFKKTFRLRPIINIIILGFIFVLLFPKYIKSYQYESFSLERLKSNLIVSQETPVLERYISNLTNNEDCILSVYGWGTPATYFYSQRKPCTRFYIPNLVSNQFKEEYQDQLIKNPPSLILYNKAGSDMNVEAFEKNIFNTDSVLKNCYVKDNLYDNIYLPAKLKIGPSDCLKTYGVVE